MSKSRSRRNKAQNLDPEYSRMLSAPASSHNDAVDPIEKEIHRLKYLRNTRVGPSRLPAELLLEVFLQLVESGLRGGNSRFGRRTFSFLQVCRHWNEVAISSPQLWGFWVACAYNAWPLFNSRSKGGPIHLTWRDELPETALDVLRDPKMPSRIRHLDFSGGDDELEGFLTIFDSNSPSNASSVRLQVAPCNDCRPGERFARLLSSPFPKLSKLNIGGLLPGPSSSVFTTSKLTSLKLFLRKEKKGSYTLAQFSQILQQQPNLRELDLNDGAIPSTGVTKAPLLPHLVDLRLHGMDVAILGFIDFIQMSSPLHNVIIHFDYVTHSTIPALAGAVKKVLAAYYDCRGLDHPRKIDSLAISLLPSESHLAFQARSRSPPISNLELQFGSIVKLGYKQVLEKTFDLFPSSDVQELTVDMLPLTRKMLEKLKELSHLRVSNLASDDIQQTLGALSPEKPHQHLIPKLESLTITRSDLTDEEQELLDILKGRHEDNLGLKRLAVRSCWMDEFEDEPKLREVVGEVEWEGKVGDDEVEEDDLDEGGSGDDESEGFDDSDYDADVDLCEPRVHVF